MPKTWVDLRAVQLLQGCKLTRDVEGGLKNASQQAGLAAALCSCATMTSHIARTASFPYNEHRGVILYRGGYIKTGWHKLVIPMHAQDWV